MWLWGCCQGVEKTRRFLLEWMSFLHRYIPLGVLERVPVHINQRPPPFVGRDDLETLMASTDANDWVKIRCVQVLNIASILECINLSCCSGVDLIAALWCV